MTDLFPPPSQLDDRRVMQAFTESAQARIPASAPLSAQVCDGILEILTPAGTILGMLGGPIDARAGVLLLGGAAGGFGGPAGSAYHDLARRLGERGIGSMRLHGREPTEVESCVQDALLALRWWQSVGLERAVAVGHSLGGATAIVVGALTPLVAGIVGLAAQNAGTELADRLAGKPLLLIHGRQDPVIPYSCAENIAARAGGPHELVLLEGCGHVMGEAVEEVVTRVETFVLGVLADGRT